MSIERKYQVAVNRLKAMQAARYVIWGEIKPSSLFLLYWMLLVADDHA